MTSVGMRVAALLAAVVTAAVVSSCGESSPTPDAQAPKHNAAAMVPSRTTNRDLVVMAKHIAMDQQAQIDTLQGLLQQWGEPAAPDHTGHEGMSMDGMVDAATMDRLPTLKDTAFDELWLRSMITHHQGAVAMAQPEIVRGENPTAVKMAKVIVDWQQLEIGRMHAMLGPAE